MDLKHDLRPHVAVMGCHSSTTRYHHEMFIHVNHYGGAPTIPFHLSIPFPHQEFLNCDSYIWVQRDPTLTAISQEHRPEAVLSGNRSDEVWQGMADAANIFRAIRRPVLYVWAQDTVRDPVTTMQRMGDFIGLPWVFTEEDVLKQPFDPDAKYLEEARGMRSDS